MNTVLLNQSAASQVIECVPGAHFVFGFPADAAELSRSGNDLVLAFADGASITLEGFYKTYTQQDMPSFEVDGANVAGADFFAAIGQSDLMPAAGPEPANDSHYQEWSNMDLLGGLDRLGGLDVGWKDGGKLPDLDGGASGSREGRALEELNVSLSVSDGGTENDVREVTFTVSLDRASLGDVSVTLSSGHTIVIPAGETSASVTISTRADDVYQQGSHTYSAAIENVSSSFALDSPMWDGNSVSANVTDDADVTTFSIEATNATEGNGFVTFTVTASNAPQGVATVQVAIGENTYDVALNENGVGTLTVAHGNTEDVYKDASSITATVTGVTGGNYEAVQTGTSATANITDTVTPVELTLTATSGGTENDVRGVTYTLSLDQALEHDITVTLNGYDVPVIITAGSTTASFTIDTRADDFYTQADQTVSVAIKEVTGADNLEKLTFSTEAVSATVIDDADATKVTLSVSEDVTEGGNVTFTASVERTSSEDITVTLSNSQNITIAAGELTGSVTVDTRTNDFYTQGEGSVSAAITGVSGGSDLESLTFDSTAVSAKVNDDADVTTFSIEATNATEGDGSVTFTVTASNAPQGVATVQVAIGENTYDVALNENGVGTLTVAHGNTEDVYKDASSITAAVTGVTGGNYEAVQTGTSATANITDTVTPVELTLTATSGGTENDVRGVTYTLSLDQALEHDITVTLNGYDVPVIITAGSTTASFTIDTRADDFYTQADQTVSVAIKEVTGADNLEKLTFSTEAVSATVTDDNDVTQVTLSVSDDVTEGGKITFTASVERTSSEDITVTLSNNQSITIAAGELTGSVTVDTRTDDFYTQGEGSVSAAITGVSGGSDLESLTFDGTGVSAKVNDDDDVTTFSIEATDATEGDGSVTFTVTASNAPQGGATVQVTIGENTYDVELNADGVGTLSVAHGNAEDVYKDASSITATVTGVTGGNYEAVQTGASATANIGDTTNTTTFSLSASPADTEGNVIFTIEASNVPYEKDEVTVLVQVQGEPEPLHVEIGPDGKGSFTMAVGDDNTVSASITQVNHSRYEAVDFSSKAVSVTVVKPESMSFTTQDAEIGSSGDTDAQALPTGVTLTQTAIDTVNSSIDYGRFSLVDGKLVFTQSETYTHDKNTNSETFDTVTFDVTDAGGNATTLDVTVTIEDDSPSIDISDFAGSYGTSITGSVNIAFRADGPAATSAVTLSMNGKTAVAGDLQDGFWTFNVEGHTVKLNAATGEFTCSLPESGTGGTYSFDFTVTDADGDSATAGTIVTVNPVSFKSSVASDDDFVPDNTDSNANNQHVVEVSLPFEAMSIVSGGEVYQTVDGEPMLIGRLSVNAGKLWFTQTATWMHQEGSDSASFTQNVQITAKNGTTQYVDVDFTINDSAPTAKSDIIDLGVDGRYGYGNVITGEMSGQDGIGADILSADGATVVSSIAYGGQRVEVAAAGETSIEGTYGTLSIKADGSYTYTLHEGITAPTTSTVKEVFQYTIKDSDGDTSTAPAGLTILMGGGTVKVKESGYGVDAYGNDVAIAGTLTATGDLDAAVVPDFSKVEVDTSGVLPSGMEVRLLHSGSCNVNKDGVSYDSYASFNYGTFYVDSDTGEYRFELNDDFANPLPHGFLINLTFSFQSGGEGVSGTQHVVVQIEGTNDMGQLDEVGMGGHASSTMWLDAKAHGSNTVDDPYDAMLDPNLDNNSRLNDAHGHLGSKTESGTNEFSRSSTWLPFKLVDVDFDETLTFEAVWNYTGNATNKAADINKGERLVDYHSFVTANPISEFSMALSVEWNNLIEKVGLDYVQDNMLFHRTEYGILAISTGKPVELEGVGTDEASYWLTFITDSDSAAHRHLADGRDTSSNKGRILQYSFRVKDEAGNVVASEMTTEGGQVSYVDVNRVLVHTYGSNDTPTLDIDTQGRLVIHDPDHSAADTDKQTLSITYNGRTYTGTLKNGDIEFKSGNSTLDAEVQASSSQHSGTTYTLTLKDVSNADITVKIEDQYGATASQKFRIDQDGDFTLISSSVTMGDGRESSTDLDESDSLYGGSTADTLYGEKGNDSIWGLGGNDSIYGGSGNDRLYGGAGNDRLVGDAGKDVLVGGAGDDILDGGAGNDVIFGDGSAQSLVEGAVNADVFVEYLRDKSALELDRFADIYEDTEGGNDVFLANEGSDLLFGQAGSDIFVYDEADALVHGGSGIDILLSDESVTLDSLLEGGKVQDVEVLVKGDNAESLTSLTALADAGITVESGKVTLSSDWQSADNGTFTNGTLTIETTLEATEAAGLIELQSIVGG